MSTVKKYMEPNYEVNLALLLGLPSPATLLYNMPITGLILK